MAKWADVRERWSWLNANLADDEPVVFKLPRREAKKRIRNTEKKHRITMVTDEQNYSEFHAMKEAYMLELGENPTMVVQAIVEAMKTFDVRGWKEDKEDDDFMMGRGDAQSSQDLPDGDR